MILKAADVMEASGAAGGGDLPGSSAPWPQVTNERFHLDWKLIEVAL